jgi:predicted phosphodiesterase
MIRSVIILLFSATMTLGQGTFTFTVTADSHLDEHTDLALYQQTLANAAADKPVFHMDLGDTFMSEKFTNRTEAAKQYLDQRRYFDLLGAPVHLVIGNHDGEGGRYLDGTTNNLAVWSRTMRLRYFPNPLAKDGRNYYAWEHGNALFVVLDPFWYTPRPRRSPDNWYRTLGTEQYQWLKRTLENSKATFKFVFIHHLVGGLDKQGRGGAEAAPFYEWGGKNADGTDGFGQHRSGWPMPIHQSLVQNHLNIVFHGHDHFYAKQDIDGIVYQEVPQPGDPKGSTRSAMEYGYKRGVILPSSGYLRVIVSPEKAKVDYVRPDKSESHSYVISVR